MAERAKQKTKRRGPGAAQAAAGLADAIGRLEARAEAVERERDALKAQLTTAEARIVALELRRTQAVDRIDWVIDSLHNMIESDR